MLAHSSLWRLILNHHSTFGEESVIFNANSHISVEGFSLVHCCFYTISILNDTCLLTDSSKLSRGRHLKSEHLPQTLPQPLQQTLPQTLPQPLPQTLPHSPFRVGTLTYCANGQCSVLLHTLVQLSQGSSLYFPYMCACHANLEQHMNTPENTKPYIYILKNDYESQWMELLTPKELLVVTQWPSDEHGKLDFVLAVKKLHSLSNTDATI